MFDLVNPFNSRYLAHGLFVGRNNLSKPGAETTFIPVEFESCRVVHVSESLDWLEGENPCSLLWPHLATSSGRVPIYTTVKI